METEIWKDIPWYEWIYKASSFWRIKSLVWNHQEYRELILKEYHQNWYSHISLQIKRKIKRYQIHRIVAISFIPNIENKTQINHKNWIKTDNRIENLEWCTPSENCLHAHKIWLAKVSKNNIFFINNPNKWKLWKNSRFSKKVNQYSKEWEFIKEWDSIMDVQRTLWISNSLISQCCSFKKRTAWWFKWYHGNLIKW